MFEELSTHLFASQRGRHIGIGLTIFLSVSLLAVVLSAVSTWHSDYLLSQKKVVTTISPVTDKTSLIVSQLPAEHLFGLENEDDNAFLPLTSLQLHLTGIMKENEGNISKAIISEAGKPGKVYKIGDILTAGIKVNAINDHEVVLEHGGHLEKLPLLRPVLSFQDAPKSLLNVG